MKRVLRRRLLLTAVVVLLVAVTGWQWRHDRARAPGTLTDLAPQAVTHITVTVPGKPPRRYVRRQAHWWRAGSPPRRVDDALMVHLAAVAAAPALQWHPAGHFDPALIGLRPPQMVLVLDGRRLAFGTMAATGPMRYVQVGRRIALIAAADTPQVPARQGIRTLSPATAGSTPADR